MRARGRAQAGAAGEELLGTGFSFGSGAHSYRTAQQEHEVILLQKTAEQALREASNFRVYTRGLNTQTETAVPNQASAYNLDHVSNSELHLSTRRLVGRSNQILAALLAHLGEIEARGIHRERACASLHT